MRLDNLWANITQKLGECLVSLAGFFGLSSGASLLSAQGIFSVFAILGTITLFIVSIKAMNRPFLTKGDGMKSDSGIDTRFIYQLFVISAIFNIFVFIIVDEPVTQRYFIPFMVLYIPLVCIIFTNMETGVSSLRRIALISGITLFIFGQGCLNFQSMVRQDVNSIRKGYIEYLETAQLDYGFASFWNANVTTELCNGQIEIAGLDFNVLNEDALNIRIFPWLNPTKYFDSSYHKGKESFLLLTRDEWNLANSKGSSFTSFTSFTERVPDYADDHFIVIKYGSTENVYQEVLGQ
jgi:hypothetical protein